MLRLIIKLMAVALLVVGSQAHGQSLSRSAATELLKKQDLGTHTIDLQSAVEVVKVRDGSLYLKFLGTNNTPFLDKLLAEGYATKEVVEWKRGMQDFYGSRNAAPHLVAYIKPTTKLQKYIVPNNNNKDIYQLHTGSVELVAVTGVSKNGEGVYAVEFNTRLVLNEIGLMRPVGAKDDISEILYAKTLGGLSSSGTKTAIFKMYDDGWRVIHKDGW